MKNKITSTPLHHLADPAQSVADLEPGNRYTVERSDPHILIHVWISRPRRGNPNFTVRIINIHEIDKIELGFPAKVWKEVFAAAEAMDTELPFQEFFCVEDNPDCRVQCPFCERV